MNINISFAIVVATFFEIFAANACTKSELPDIGNIPDFINGVNGKSFYVNEKVYTVPLWFYLTKKEHVGSDELYADTDKYADTEKLRWLGYDLDKGLSPVWEGMFIKLIKELINNGYKIELVPKKPGNPIYSLDKSPLLSRPVTFKWKITPPHSPLIKKVPSQ